MNIVYLPKTYMDPGSSHHPPLSALVSELEFSTGLHTEMIYLVGCRPFGEQATPLVKNIDV